jgi:cold shock CspA family protein
MSTKTPGRISVWFELKNYGFIAENRDGKLVKWFLHIANVLEGTPVTGAKVLFNQGSNDRGLLALDVEVLPIVPDNTMSAAATALSGRVSGKETVGGAS